MTAVSPSRRRFLSAASIATLGLSPLCELLAAAGVPRSDASASAGFGALRPCLDMTTGLPLLRLPKGFSYRSFGWAGERLADGSICPGSHDGMGMAKAIGDRLTLIRNHEVTRVEGAFGPVGSHYDPICSGGTVTLSFDADRGELVEARASLSGTLTNCSGGVTPWGSWLSCEEIVVNAGAVVGGGSTLARDHGFIFEVPADGPSEAVALRAMGQFRHEAVAVHAASGTLYLTEDRRPSAGFYRFLPTTPGRLSEGGRLQILAVEGATDLRRGARTGDRWATRWIDIAHPESGTESRPEAGDEHDLLAEREADFSGIDGVQNQGWAQGAARFTRLEGCIASESEIFFTSTDGGDAGCGQVFSYRPDSGELRLVLQSPSRAVLDYPDNIVISPRGGMVICQDAKEIPQRLYAMSQAAEVFPFAEQNVVLDGSAKARGFRGDFRSAEWAGACFSPDGRWLFANVYSPGFSVAITGPWRDGLI